MTLVIAGSSAFSSGFSSREFFEDPDEDRHDEGDDPDHRADRRGEDQRRIHQRRFDLAAQRVDFLDVGGHPVERLLEPTGLLAGADHRPVEAVEDPWLALHRLRQRGAGLDVAADAVDRLGDLLVLGLLLERARAPAASASPRRQGRELARDDREVAHRHPLEAPEDVLDVDRARLLGDVEDDEAALAQLLGDLGFGFGLDLALGRDAREVDGLEGEGCSGGHRLAPSPAGTAC